VIKKVLSAALVVAALSLTAGCATPGEPTISASPSATPEPTFTTMTPAQAKAAYKKIAEASCDAAQEFGVVEVSGDTTVVMTPKIKGYKDYNAAYFTSPDTYEIIWELTGLYSCADWYTFSMSDEAGVEAAIDVTFDETTGKFSTTQTFDQETYTYVSTITNGKISSVYSPATKNDTSLRYGNQTEDDQKILVTAVDRYLATIDQ
jgi:hypothetical protein